MSKIYGDHPIESCSLSFEECRAYDFRSSPIDWSEKISQKVRDYNKSARANEADIVSLMQALVPKVNALKPKKIRKRNHQCFPSGIQWIWTGRKS
jgi:hypothetical protein